MDDEDAGYKEKLKQLGFSLLQDDTMYVKNKCCNLNSYENYHEMKHFCSFLIYILIAFIL